MNTARINSTTERTELPVRPPVALLQLIAEKMKTPAMQTENKRLIHIDESLNSPSALYQKKKMSQTTMPVRNVTAGINNLFLVFTNLHFITSQLDRIELVPTLREKVYPDGFYRDGRCCLPRSFFAGRRLLA